MTKFLICALLMCLGFGGNMAFAQDEQEEPIDFSSVEPLLSDDADVRGSTAQALINQRTLAAEFLRQEMAKPSFWEDTHFEGKVATSLQVVNRMKLDELTGILIDHIDFKLDLTTARRGGRLVFGATLPVSRALIAIGGTEVPKRLLLKLGDRQTQEQRICCLYVLSQMYSGFLPYVLDKEIERYPVDFTRSNLEKAQAALPTLLNDYAEYASARIEKVDKAPVVP